ncbi:hypothetical protein V1478_001395 [Vespula squamosa]|uniref:Uncharacterized protein n=1 Tax=Vespula squamosa TaxID=30214 RepID=A0ABD2C1E8_VESSQ
MKETEPLRARGPVPVATVDKPSPSPSIQPLDAWKKGWKTLWSKLGVGWEFVGGEYERIARLGHNTKGAVNSA